MKSLDIISFEWLCVWRFYALLLWKWMRYVCCVVFFFFGYTHTYSECCPLSNKLLQMWHFHPRFDQNVKSAEMWARTTEIPIKQKKYKRRPKTHYKQMLVTNRKHTELYVVAALKRWIFDVKQQLLVMYWFWCWLIQMPCQSRSYATKDT